MPRYHLKQGREDTSPVVLRIEADEGEVILKLEPPSYRTGDAVIKQMLLVQWPEYVASVTEGSPERLTDMMLFEEFLVATYGEETYVVTKLY